MINKIRTAVPRILNRLGYFNRMGYSRRVKIHDKAWRIPIINQTGYGMALGDDTEPWIYKVLAELNQEVGIDCFIDVGVNTGQSLIKIKSINANIQYVGFEPNPECVFYVEQLIKLNTLHNTQLICIGLGDQLSFMNLHFEGQTDTRATVMEAWKQLQSLGFTRQIPIAPLDLIPFNFPETKAIVLKVDVEGFELEVFRGAEQYINKVSPALLFEVLPHFNDTILIEKQRMLFHWLVSHGYTTYNIDHKARRSLVINGFLHNNSDFEQTDFLAVNNQGVYPVTTLN